MNASSYERQALGNVPGLRIACLCWEYLSSLEPVQ